MNGLQKLLVTNIEIISFYGITVMIVKKKSTNKARRRSFLWQQAIANSKKKISVLVPNDEQSFN